MLSWQFIILFHSQMFWRWWLMISVILKMTECTGTLSVSLSLSTCPILTPPSHIYKWLLTSWMCMRIINRAVFTSQLSSRRRRHTPDRRPTIHETDGPQNLIKNVVSEGPRDRHTCPPPPPTSRRHHIILFRSFACGQLLRDYHESTALYWGPYNQYYSRIARYPFNTSGSRGR